MAIFTDIHFGARANSIQHNEDCIRFIEWFIEQVRLDGNIDSIGFLGDWHENRSALNIQTLNFAHRGAQMINDVGLPVFFTIGNHDLFHRHSRELNSVPHFDEFENFIMVPEPQVFENDKGDDFFLCPYMFHDEYPSLTKFLGTPVWMGHFEFKDFIVTGQGRVMPTGPDAAAFAGPKLIMSGHFHKRQANRNVAYIGNTFPTNFGDAGDDERGMIFYDFTSEYPGIEFLNWEECPKYRKCKLSQLLDGEVTMSKDMRVKCVADVPISFEESTKLTEKFITDFELREFTLEESMELREALAETESGIDWTTQQLAGVDELVAQMLYEIESDHIDNATLIKIYDGLKPL